MQSKRWLLILFFTLISAELVAQGFNMISGRNHPYLNWQVAETAHFQIMYPERLAGIEAEAAAIAEASYDALSNNLNVTFDKKIRIYLSDEDEINNGFAVPIGNGYTNIWVGLNEYAETWTGQEKWLRKVIAHELAHIFHFEATRTNMGLWNYVFGNPTPSFWTEGLAQYQTEKWDSQRGDRWLRMAIFDSRPSYTDGQSLQNRRLLYASGNSQLRYFAEAYGDSALADMLAQRESLGLYEVHDFESAFRKTTGKSHNEFYDEWRKHMNIYYNTLASQMDRLDSLNSKPEQLPGQYYFDLKYSPDQSRIAVLSIPSLQRPVRRLFIVENDSARTSEIAAEGNIKNDLAWSSDGEKIAYSRTVRGENSSLLNDIFLLDIDNRRERQLTHSRRAISPAFSRDGNELAYIVNEGGTGNIFILDLETGDERRVTDYWGDVQLITLNWNRPRNELVFQRFDAEGNRFLITLNPESGKERVIDKDGAQDNRSPLISPDGSRIVYTSLRDDVPNVFMTDLDADSTWRVTHLITGAEAYDWLSRSDTLESEKLVVKATETKRSEEIYLVDSGMKRGNLAPDINPDYTTWRAHEPPVVIPWQIRPDNRLIEQRYPYRAGKNLTHTLSFLLPYFGGSNDYGLVGFTSWTEPLAKHLVSAGGTFSIADPSDSYGLLTYINNQFYPTVSLNAYRMPGSARFYGNRFLVENLTGGDLSVFWPLDRFEDSYTESQFGTRLRYVSIDPYTYRDFDESFWIPSPEAGRQLDLRLSWVVKKQRPWYRNLIHPLDGYGIRFMMTGAQQNLGSDTSYLNMDFSAYRVFPAPGLHRLFLYGRFQVQTGDPLPQNFIGFSRYDNIDLPVPVGFLFLQTFEAERVRGYRDFVTGSQVAFASAEYRMPFFPSLNTTILGFLGFGSTTLSLFADAGIVWEARPRPNYHSQDRRLGLGTEVNNIVRLGPIQFVHSLGIAQPYDELFKRDEVDLYYRVKASVPF